MMVAEWWGKSEPGEMQDADSVGPGGCREGGVWVTLGYVDSKVPVRHPRDVCLFVYLLRQSLTV